MCSSDLVSLVNRGIEVITPNAQEYSAQCGAFYDATGQNASADEYGARIKHLGQTEFDRAVAYARTTESPTSGSFSWLRVGSTDLTPLIAATLAMYGYESKKPDDYDLGQSIPDDYNQCRYCYACEIDGFLAHKPHCERPR